MHSIKTNIKLSIIILNHNSGNLLLECLNSLFVDKFNFEFEIIVPDNASTDNSLNVAIEKWGNRLKIIRNKENLGFAWGNNIGIRESIGEFVCLLNPDTVINLGTFNELVNFMNNHKRAGIIGPKVLNKDGTFQLSAKRSIPSPFDAISRALLLSKIFPKSKKFAHYNLTYLHPDETHPVDASTGCCMLTRREMINEIGLLDEGYFIYCEDVDWFLRAKKANWEVWYVASASIEHHHSYSEKFRKQKAVKDFHNSMIRFYHKHHAINYPFIFNQLIYLGVYCRMYFLIVLKTLKQWWD